MYRVLMSDTLGGNIINICKLYGIYKEYKCKFKLYRASELVNAWCDPMLKDLYSLFDFVEYGGPVFDIFDEYEDYANSNVVTNVKLRKDFREKYLYDLVSYNADFIREVFPNYKGINCYPPVNIDKINLGENSVVIQPWGGKFFENFAHGATRVFHIEALDNMCEVLVKNNYTVYLVGQSNKWFFSESDFSDLEEKYGVNNLVNKLEFKDALQYVASANYVIGFDGIFVFFSSLFKIPTINFSILNPNPRLSKSNDTCECWKTHCLLIAGIPGGIPIVFDMQQFKYFFNKLKELNGISSYVS